MACAAGLGGPAAAGLGCCSLAQERRASNCSADSEFLGAGRRRLLALPSPATSLPSSDATQRPGVSVRAKGKRNAMPGGVRRGAGQQAMPSLPKIDTADDTPKFVLFIRTKNVSRWYPLSVITGGTAAKLMLGAMKNDIGKRLYQGTLTRNIASVVYNDERAVRTTAIKAYPVLKAATGFEYGYKVMDNNNPRAAMFGTDVVQIPPQEEIATGIVDKVKGFFGNAAGSLKGAFGSITSAIPVSPPVEDNKK
eukprot:SM000129S26162  [mRNA]  locus=s129:362264:364482:+ [translate_table: standard]